MDIDDITSENMSISNSELTSRNGAPWLTSMSDRNSTTNAGRHENVEASLSSTPRSFSRFDYDVSFVGSSENNMNSQRRNADSSIPFRQDSGSANDNSESEDNIAVDSITNTEIADNEMSNSTSNRLFREGLRLLNELSGENNEERANNSPGRNALNETETIHILSESSDAENDDNTEYNGNRRRNDSGPASILHSHNCSMRSSSHADNVDHLFAPEDSSSSSENSLPEVQSPFLPLPPSNPYSSFLGTASCSRQSTSREDRPLFRFAPRYSRYLSQQSPFYFSANPDSTSLRDSQLNFGTSRRLSSYLLNNRTRLWSTRYRPRSSHSDLVSRSRVSAALNASSSSNNDETVSFSEENERELPSQAPFRRNACLPKLYTEWRRRYPATSSDCDSSRPSVGHERLASNGRIPNLLRSIIDFQNSLGGSKSRERPLCSTRARSVSPTSANPWFSSSIDEDSIDDIGVNLRSDNSRAAGRRFITETHEEQFQRPSTPLPPTLSDDESPLTPSNFEGELLNLTTESCASTSHQQNIIPVPISGSDSSKQAPRTYDELNNELIQLLECPICFEYSTPPINQCLQGHVICNNCRQKVSTCPTCRTIFQESRNLMMEKVAALLRYPCKNAVTGCCESLNLLQKERHEMSCGYRQYVCFIPLCNWRGYKPELLVHVQETHESHVIHGATVNLLIPISGQTKKVWLMSAFNELFYVIFFATLGILKGCVRYIGDPNKCDSYTYNISVTSEEEMLRTFNYTRTTHAYEETFENDDMIDSVDLFSISHAQLNLFRKGTKAPIRVAIEEAQTRLRPGFAAASSSI